MEKLVVAAALLAVAVSGIYLAGRPPQGFSALYVNDAPNFSLTVENHWPQAVSYALLVAHPDGNDSRNFSLPPGANASFAYPFFSGSALLADGYGNEYRVQRS